MFEYLVFTCIYLKHGFWAQTLASEVPGMWETTHPSCHCGHRNGVRSMGSRSESTTPCANTSWRGWVASRGCV